MFLVRHNTPNPYCFPRDYSRAKRKLLLNLKMSREIPEMHFCKSGFLKNQQHGPVAASGKLPDFEPQPQQQPQLLPLEQLLLHQFPPLPFNRWVNRRV